jgi:hypothetical protein
VLIVSLSLVARTCKLLIGVFHNGVHVSVYDTIIMKFDPKYFVIEHCSALGDGSWI